MRGKSGFGLKFEVQSLKSVYMARFRIIRSLWETPCLVLEVELLNGTVVSGVSFSVWDTCHRYDFNVAEVRLHGNETQLLCTSGLLYQFAPDEVWPNIFAGKQVDTENPEVAQSFSHK